MEGTLPDAAAESEEGKGEECRIPKEGGEACRGDHECGKEAQQAVEQEFKAEFARLLAMEKEKTKEAEAEVQRRTFVAHQEVNDLKVELRQASQMAAVNNIMMTEYAEMHMGKKYEEHAGYYDGEMFVWAEEKLRMREEMAALDELQEMQKQYAIDQGWEVPSPEKGRSSSARIQVRKDSKSPGRGARRR